MGDQLESELVFGRFEDTDIISVTENHPDAQCVHTFTYFVNVRIRLTRPNKVVLDYDKTLVNAVLSMFAQKGIKREMKAVLGITPHTVLLKDSLSKNVCVKMKLAKLPMIHSRLSIYREDAVFFLFQDPAIRAWVFTKHDHSDDGSGGDCSCFVINQRGAHSAERDPFFVFQHDLLKCPLKPLRYFLPLSSSMCIYWNFVTGKPETMSINAAVNHFNDCCIKKEETEMVPKLPEFPLTVLTRDGEIGVKEPTATEAGFVHFKPYDTDVTVQTTVYGKPGVLTKFIGAFTNSTGRTETLFAHFASSTIEFSSIVARGAEFQSSSDLPDFSLPNLGEPSFALSSESPFLLVRFLGHETKRDNIYAYLLKTGELVNTIVADSKWIMSAPVGNVFMVTANKTIRFVDITEKFVL